MYSPVAYYMALSLSFLVIYAAYPIATACISYWFFGFKDADFVGMLDWAYALSCQSILGSVWGFSLGSFFSCEMSALQANIVFVMLFNLGAGHSANLGQ